MKWKQWMPALAGMLAVLVVLFSFDGFVEAAGAPSQPVKKVTIVHTNDIHSRAEETEEHIGLAKLSSIIKQIKASNPNTFVLDAGDSFHGQTIANLVRGESIVRLMNEIGFDAMTTGNHDYNYGSGRLVELADIAEFPVLAANVYKDDGTRLMEPYVTITVDGIQFGIFGLATPETLYKTHPNNVAGLTFADPAEEARNMVAVLKDQVDVIIALTHVGLDESSEDTSMQIAEQVEGIDLIVDGHSHTVLEEGLWVGDTLIVQAGEYGKYAGIVELEFAGKELVHTQAALLSRADAEDIQPDQTVADMISSIKEEQEEVLSEVVGTSAADLDGERESVRTGETNLGNLITDAMVDETGADLAITNGGGIRASIPAGSITKGDVITVLPFGNYIQTKQVSGADIMAALEHGVGSYPDSLGAFPHVSGIQFSLDPSKPHGERVHSVTIQGLPLDEGKSYVMATNDFMAAGGDEYTMFSPQPIIGDFSSLEESLIRYIQKQGELDRKAEGRIRIAASPGGITTGEQPDGLPVVPPEAPGIPEGSTGTVEEMPELPKTLESGGPEPENRIYVVQRGDSLWKIANEYGTTWQHLHKLNNLNNPDLIYPNQPILLP